MMFSVQVLLIGAFFNTGTHASYQYVDEIVLKRQGVADILLDPLTVNDWTIKDETNILVHEYTGSSSSPWVVQTAEHFLNLDHNVILVNYQTIAAKEYNLAADESVLVGIEVSTVLANLINNNALDPATIDMVGFSLGAQVAGFIGHYFHEVTGQQINTITGLDPAGPNFAGKPNSGQLDSSDGVFVQVMHTNYYYGNRNKISDVDFVINKPKNGQPGCSGLFKMVCSHYRAVQLYVDSLGDSCPVYSATICGRPRESFNVGIGYKADPSIQGEICVEAPGKRPNWCGI